MKCPDCSEPIADGATACECGWRDKPKIALPKPKRLCQYCSAPIVWTNGRTQVCLKHYDEHIYPQVVATKTDIAFHKRLREIEAWIAAHPEYNTKREACLHALKARGLESLLPEKLRE